MQFYKKKNQKREAIDGVNHHHQKADYGIHSNTMNPSALCASKFLMQETCSKSKKKWLQLPAPMNDTYIILL